MKRIVLLLLLTLLLVGCQSETDESQLPTGVSQADRERYTTLVEKTLYDTYWRYSADSLEFVQAVVPEQNEQNAGMFAASSDMGFAMESHAGKPVVSATVDLLHYNGEAAGRAYFYFSRGAIAGVYYSGGYKEDAHSLKERNLFLANPGFEKFETAAVDSGSFLSQAMQFPPDGYQAAALNDRNQIFLASIELGNVVVYRFNQTFSRYRMLYFNSGNLEATSVAMFPSENENVLAVLVSAIEEENHSEGNSESISSVKVAFYDQRFSKTGEMLLPSVNYTCVASDGNQLVLADSQALEYYENAGNGYEKKKQYFLDHGVTDFHAADLDGDGVMEYIITDAQDLYLYHKADSSFIKLWSTHLGIPSLSGNIYTGDLNQDGVKEIYIGDTTGTMIRYTLTSSGLRSSNSDVEYGDRIYPLDIDGDGYDDYIRLNNVEGLECWLYTADLSEGE